MSVAEQSNTLNTRALCFVPDCYKVHGMVRDVWSRPRHETLGGNLNDSSEASSQNNEKLLSDQRGIF